MRSIWLVWCLVAASAVARSQCVEHACSNDSATPPVYGDEWATWDWPAWPCDQDLDGTPDTAGIPTGWELLRERPGLPVGDAEVVRWQSRMWVDREDGRGGRWVLPRRQSPYTLRPEYLADPGTSQRYLVRARWMCGTIPVWSSPASAVEFVLGPYTWFDLTQYGDRCERRMSVGAPLHFVPHIPECPS